MCQILSVCFLLPNVEEKAIIIVYLYTFYLFIYYINLKIYLLNRI